jgi:hypothetical protein
MKHYAVKVPYTNKVRLTTDEVQVTLQRIRIPWASKVRLRAVTTDNQTTPWLVESRTSFPLKDKDSRCRIRSNKDPYFVEKCLPNALATPTLSVTVVKRDS